MKQDFSQNRFNYNWARIMATRARDVLLLTCFWFYFPSLSAQDIPTESAVDKPNPEEAQSPGGGIAEVLYRAAFDDWLDSVALLNVYVSVAEDALVEFERDSSRQGRDVVADQLAKCVDLFAVVDQKGAALQARVEGMRKFFSAEELEEIDQLVDEVSGELNLIASKFRKIKDNLAAR